MWGLETEKLSSRSFSINLSTFLHIIALNAVLLSPALSY